MSGIRLSPSVIAASLGLTLASAPAAALVKVSFVSSLTGSDFDGCGSESAPCRSINAALEETEPGGEIRCVDFLQDFGVSIGQPVTIDCDVPSSVISVGLFGSPAIIVNLSEDSYPNGVVTLRNLTIDGFSGSVTSTDGIRVTGAGAALRIEHCTIQGFGEQGIDFAPSSGVDLFIKDTSISNNAGGGVYVHPKAAAGAARGLLTNVSLDHNGAFGLAVVKAGGGIADIAVDDTQVEGNGAGLRANGARASILLSDSTIAHNTTGLQVQNGGKIISFGNNAINRNTANGAPTSTTTLK